MKKCKTGGTTNKNKTVTASTKATTYKGGVSKAPATADKSASKYKGGISKAPAGATPSKSGKKK